jgi:hypothetical protein
MRGAAMRRGNWIVLAGLLGPAVGVPAGARGDLGSLEPALAGDPGVLFYGGFSAQPWTGPWACAWGPSPAEQAWTLPAERPCGGAGRVLRVRYPKGTIGGPLGGMQFMSPFVRLGLAPCDHLFLRYYVRFAPDFDFVKGGKLPGLVGGEANTGGHIPNGRDGFSVRLMWRPGSRVVAYVYHPDQATQWGDDFRFTQGSGDCRFKPGQWHCVETEVRLNTPGRHDGLVRGWFDGEAVLEHAGLRFRDIPGLKIDGFYFSTFFGGGDLSWAARKDEHVDYDAFVISTQRVGPAAGQPGALRFPKPR